MKEKGILVSSFSGQTIRLVTHLDVDDGGIQRTMEAMKQFGD
jgi:hypothetical protein